MAVMCLMRGAQALQATHFILGQPKEVPGRCQQSHFTDQGTTAWLDQSEAAGWPSLGVGDPQEKIARAPVLSAHSASSDRDL